MTFDPRHSVDDGLHHLANLLDPIIGVRLAQSLGGLPWPTVLSELDKMKGKTPKSYSATDLQSQLRIITERLGNLGYPFDDHTRVVSTLGNELRIVRNRWAHHDDLTALDAWRAHDFAVRLLEHFGDEPGAVDARKLRDAAFDSLAVERGIAEHVVPAPTQPVEPSESDPDAQPEGEAQPEAEVVRPDPSVLTRSDSTETPTIGSGRSEFEPWAVVAVGDVAVLDDLPKKVAKDKVRAVAVEIADFEGPIHINRLAALTAASFGVQRLWSEREKKLIYQIKQTGLVVDDDKTVWPTDLDPKAWTEFRPNDSTVDRQFTEISPVEVANAMRFLKENNPGISEADLDTATLQTFGRKRRTKQFAAHLDKVRSLLSVKP
ncbi:Swt1 family HEPN domain-containing protein [Gordonia sp. DT219]|uniref:Swt1 family HEPN domain-containing protein n=1 Tax=Gordonia sp. DT219 TaxID=3416658 RepID=UPI003CFBB351